MKCENQVCTRCGKEGLKVVETTRLFYHLECPICKAKYSAYRNAQEIVYAEDDTLDNWF